MPYFSFLASRLGPAALALAAATMLPGCHRPETPQTPGPSDVPEPRVTPSADLKGASDHADAPPAIGALTGGDQASGGAKRGSIPPTAGDGVASGPASGPMR